MNMKRLAPILFLPLLLAAACSDDPTPPEIGESFFYLLVYPGAVWDGLGTGNHYAMALTLHTTVDIQCADVQALTMTRQSDGRPFAWRLDPPTDGFCGYAFNPRFPGDACCTLPGADNDSLAAGDLRPGATYTLTYETDRVRARGSTTVPDSFTVNVVRDGTRTVAVWSRSAGAGGYAVTIDHGDPVLTTDTTLELPRSGRLVHVEALDPNYYRYVTEEPLRSGIDAGLGLFGAVWGPEPVPY